MNIDRALSDVHDDLQLAGFLTDPIYAVDTYLVYLGLSMETFGYYRGGNIYVVRNMIPDLIRPCLGGQRQWRTFRGVIHHEFGHNHRSDIRWRSFRSCFGRRIRCGREGCKIQQITQEQVMTSESTRPKLVQPILFLVLGLAMVAAAWLMTRPNPEKKKIQRQKQEFFAVTGSQLLNQEAQRNREAMERARRQLAANFARYRQGVPNFAEDLTTWSTRYEITKAALADWWNESNEGRKIATGKFAKFVVSDRQLQRDVTAVLAQFSSDLEANRNKMLSELQERISTAAVLCASTDLGSTNLAGAFILEAQPLIKARAMQCPAIGALATGGGFIVGDAAANIVTKLLASMAARVATGAAARGSAVAAGALTGGGGGTAITPGVGTAIGLAGGIVVGSAVDWWMEGRFKAKVTGECNQILSHMEEALWNDGAQGLENAFTKAITATRECHEVAMQKVITGGAQ
jgi:hypothetical protein